MENLYFICWIRKSLSGWINVSKSSELKQNLWNSCHSMKSSATAGPDLPLGLNMCTMPTVPWVTSVVTPVSTLGYLGSPLFLLEHILLLPLDFPYNPLYLPSHMTLDFPKLARQLKDFFADNDSESSRSEFEYLREPHCLCCAGREGDSVLDGDSWRQNLCDC